MSYLFCCYCWCVCSVYTAVSLRSFFPSFSVSVAVSRCASLCAFPLVCNIFRWFATTAMAHLKFNSFVFFRLLMWNLKFQFQWWTVSVYLSGCITSATATNLNFQLINVWLWEKFSLSAVCLFVVVSLLEMKKKKSACCIWNFNAYGNIDNFFYMSDVPTAYSHNGLMLTTGLYGKLFFYREKPHNKQIRWEKSESNRFIERVTYKSIKRISRK